jgi:hypothetical protein
MKTLKFMVLALMATALLVGPVYAQFTDSEIDITALNSPDSDVDGEPSGPVIVGWEWLNELFQTNPSFFVSVDLGAAKYRPCSELANRSNLVYVSTVDIHDGTLITMAVRGGSIEVESPGNLVLYDLDDGRIAASLSDYSFNGDVQYLKFKFNLCCDEGLPDLVKAGHRLIMLASLSERKKPVLLFNYGSLDGNNDEMTIEVSEVLDDTGIALYLPTTRPETLVKIRRKNQLFARVEYRAGGSEQNFMKEGFATAVIDMYADPTRALFVDEGSDSIVDTGSTTSTKAEILVVDAGSNGGLQVQGTPWGFINYGFCIDDARFKMQIWGHQDGIAKIEINTLSNGTLATNTPFFLDNSSTYWEANSNFATDDLRDALQNDVRITVNGATSLEPALYLVNLEVIPFESGKPILLLDKDATDESSHAFHWAINGQQVRIPYILIEATNSHYTSFFTVANRTDRKAEVFAKAIVSNEDNTFNKELEFSHSIMTVEPYSVTVFKENQIAELIGSPVIDGKIWRCALTLYIATKDDESDVTAFQIDSNGRTQIPVLYDLKLPYDKGRDWVQ